MHAFNEQLDEAAEAFSGREHAPEAFLGQTATPPTQVRLTLVPPLEVPQIHEAPELSSGEIVFASIAHRLHDEDAYPFSAASFDLTGRTGDMIRTSNNHRDGVRAAHSLSAQVAVDAWNQGGHRTRISRVFFPPKSYGRSETIESDFR